MLEAEEECKPPPIKLTLPKPQMYTYTTSPTNSREEALGTWGSLQYNPTTTVHEGGAVLKFKFGYFIRIETKKK